MTNIKLIMQSKAIKKNYANKRFDIYDRSLKFAADVAKLLERLPKSVAIYEYQRQLIRASGSVGANLSEADGSLSKKEFLNKMGIARREARESRHWLNLIQAVQTNFDEKMVSELTRLIQESQEILLILSAIIQKVKKQT